jgi:hypothetical protein
MGEDLSVEQACEILRRAFAPLQCIAEPLPFGTGVRFRVLAPTAEDLVTWESIPLLIACNSAHLRDIIKATRTKVTAKGFQLEPWAFPKAEPRSRPA